MHRKMIKAKFEEVKTKSHRPSTQKIETMGKTQNTASMKYSHVYFRHTILERKNNSLKYF